ncbi:MAG: PorV/PorQ family protein [Elusimicrobia bacterium]|nr:PorV/PorQ family protein [Elusimicrobiota bacterium]
MSLICVISDCCANGTSGIAAEYLLSFYPDARTSALAGAATSLSGSSSSIYYNPAGIASDFYNELSFFYTPLFYGTKFTYISYSYPLAPKETIAGSIGVLSTGDIEKTNSVGETLYDFSSQDTVFNLDYAVNLGGPIDGGINIKFLTQSIDDFSAHAFSADAGVVSTEEDTKYGIAVKNVIPLKLGNDKLPMSLRLGLAQRIYDKLYFSGDLAFDNILQKSISKLFFGAEYQYKVYFFRVGTNYKETTCGIGVAEDKFSLDYAVSFHTLDITHRFSIALRFGVESTEAEKHAIKLLEENKLKVDEEEVRISQKRKDLAKDIEVFNVEKEKVEKLLMNDANLKKEWQKIQSEKEQISFELENARKKQQFSQMLLNAQKYFDKKEYENASDITNQILKEDPQNEQGLTLLRKISEMSTSTFAKEKYLKAVDFYEQGRFSDAALKAGEVIQIDGGYIDAQVLIHKSKAQNYIIQKRYQDAKYELVEAIKINPNDKSILEFLQRVQTILDVMEGK